jgi:hypothetical protein
MFMGGFGSDRGNDIAVDGSGNSYVVGMSSACWGLGARAFADRDTSENHWIGDVFTAAVDASGTLLWNTFLGAYDYDYGQGVTADRSGNVYVTGSSHASWGTPVAPFAGSDFSNSNAFTARLDTQQLSPTRTGFACSRMDDGWVLESAETSGQGGSIQTTGLTFNLGDDAENKQYRALLSFDTSGIPQGAVINKVTLKIKRFGLVGTNPFFTHGNLEVDIQSPYFGSSVMLEPGDFGAPGATPLPAATIYQSTHTADWWYWTDFSADAFPYINRTGTTQFRLKFLKDDNDDLGADYLRFFRYAAGAYKKYYAYKPALVIEYSLP